ncbi:MAG: hypothetical protein RL385_147 [Pseudomonadota bacterium]|jgi:hypothetical protein
MTDEELRVLEIARTFPEFLAAARAGTIHANQPGHLYHYTDVRGLIGILQHGCLWATNSRFLNDASEASYALDLLERAIDECLERTSNEAAHKLLEPFKGRWVTNGYSFYVACFCQDGDLLNQWRVYAPNDGFSLRFDTAELLRGQDEANPRHYFSLMRVVYDEDEQRALLDELLGLAVKYAETHFPNPGDVDRADKSLRNSFHQPLMRLLLAFKHPAFNVEQEWRLVSGIGGPMSDTKFRAGRYGLTPYIEFSCPVLERQQGQPRNKLPISQVRVGPNANGDLAGHATCGLLQSLGYGDVSVEGSLLPVR